MRASIVLLLFFLSSPALSQLTGKLYWTDGSGIHRSNLDGTEMEESLVKPDPRRPTNMVLDRSNGKIYWVDRYSTDIYRSDLDGSNLELFHLWGGPAILRLDVDSDRDRLIIGAMLPAGDYYEGAIFWVDLNRESAGGFAGLSPDCYLASVGVSDLALDPVQDRLYFMTQSWPGSGDPVIRGVNLEYLPPDSADGCLEDYYWDSDEVIRAGGFVERIALDLGDRKIYWMETRRLEDRSYTTSIRRADLDGSRVELVLDDLDIPRLDDAEGFDVDSEGGKLYWLERGDQIARCNLDGSDIERNFMDQLSWIDVEVHDGRIYWTDPRGRVRRAAVDGRDVEDIFAPPVRSTSHLALDSARGRVYWTDGVAGSIQSADLDGSGMEPLVADLWNPRAITLVGDKLFWADAAPPDWRIQTSNLDGSDLEDVITFRGHPAIREMAFDRSGERLLWTGSCSSLGNNYIWSCNLDGSDVDSLFVGTSICPANVAVDEATGDVYWNVHWSERSTDYGVWRTSIGDTSSTLIPNVGADAFAFDWAHGKVYWSATWWYGDWWSFISRSNLDGSDEEAIRGVHRASIGDISLYLPSGTSIASTPSPLGTALQASFPNPFNAATWIHYSLDTAGLVQLEVHNTLGQLVRTLVDEFQDAGLHRLSWDARDDRGVSVGSGVYLLRLTHSNQVLLRRLLYLK